MNLDKLENIDKLYFNSCDISRKLSISVKSAQVAASRYVNSNRLIRIKRDIFILPQKIKTISEGQLFSIANILQVPSYISLTTALSFFNLSTQQTRYYIESIGLKRSKNVNVDGIEFNFSIVKKDFYFGFNRQNDHFIATPQKALADSIYLTAIGKYNADFDAVDLEKFDKTEIYNLLLKSNKAAQNLWQKLIRNYNL